LQAFPPKPLPLTAGPGLPSRKSDENVQLRNAAFRRQPPTRLRRACGSYLLWEVKAQKGRARFFAKSRSACPEWGQQNLQPE
jgi:hypothetical protein